MVLIVEKLNPEGMTGFSIEYIGLQNNPEGMTGFSIEYIGLQNSPEGMTRLNK